MVKNNWIFDILEQIQTISDQIQIIFDINQLFQLKSDKI